jgi:hypothetical protein
MTEQQEAEYRRLLATSASTLPKGDEGDDFIYLRGWNGALKHAAAMLDKAKEPKP